ncbi:adenosine receptor A1-like [Oculina patagonica]
MYKSVTNSTSLNLFNLKSVGGHGSAFYCVTLASSVVIAILSPVAVVGNALVLAAIWRNLSLRTTSYILLAGLAFTDFGTGLITQPIYVVKNVIRLIQPQLNPVEYRTSYIIIRALANGCATLFTNMTLLILTLMSIERWLHMTRRSLITVRRACFILLLFLFISIPLAVYRVLNDIRGTGEPETDIRSLLVLLFFLIVTSTAYFKVFRIIRRHQQQIQASELSQNCAQPAINFEKYKKSIFSILFILAVFYIGYIPVLIALGLQLVSNNQALTVTLLDVSMVCIFLSSSLNPILYLWRMKDIRKEIRQLVKRILRLEN